MKGRQQRAVENHFAAAAPNSSRPSSRGSAPGRTRHRDAGSGTDSGAQVTTQGRSLPNSRRGGGTATTARPTSLGMEGVISGASQEDFECISPKKNQRELPGLEDNGLQASEDVLEVLLNSLQVPSSQPPATETLSQGGGAGVWKQNGTSVALAQGREPYQPSGENHQQQLGQGHSHIGAVDGQRSPCWGQASSTAGQEEETPIAENGSQNSMQLFRGAAGRGGIDNAESATLALLGEVLRDNATLTTAVDEVMRRLARLEDDVKGVVSQAPPSTGKLMDNHTNNREAVALEPPPCVALPVPFPLVQSIAAVEAPSSPPKQPLPPPPVDASLQSLPHAQAHALLAEVAPAYPVESRTAVASSLQGTSCPASVQTEAEWGEDLAVLTGLLGHRGVEDQEVLLTNLTSEELALLEVKLLDVVRAIRRVRECRSPRRRKSPEEIERAPSPAKPQEVHVPPSSLKLCASPATASAATALENAARNDFAWPKSPPSIGVHEMSLVGGEAD